MRVNIKDEPKTLCARCQSATVVKLADNRVNIRCAVLRHDVRKEVVECSSFSKIGDMSLWDMENRAWLLDNRPGRRAGFISPGTAAYRKLRDLIDLD